MPSVAVLQPAARLESWGQLARLLGAAIGLGLLLGLCWRDTKPVPLALPVAGGYACHTCWGYAD